MIAYSKSLTDLHKRKFPSNSGYVTSYLSEIFIAAFKSLSLDIPHSVQVKILSDRLNLTSALTPQDEHICDVFLGFTSSIATFFPYFI